MCEITTVPQMIAEMKYRAAMVGVEPTENLEKIAKARIKMGIPITVCPCGSKDVDRGCISPKCLKEIHEKGQCHCCGFKRKGVNNVEFDKGSSAL